MKIKDFSLLVFLLSCAVLLIAFSPDAKQGAYNGLVLAENTIIPSLLPLLIIFLMIMKTGARDILSRAFGFISKAIFNLPHAAFPAVFLGLCGGYPTGALLTQELFKSEEISREQAKRLLRFDFCGGAGFIITALGSGVMKSLRAGIILFLSNVLASVVLGFALSFCEKRNKEGFYSFYTKTDIAASLNESTSSAVNSVLNMTAYIVLFSAISGVVALPASLAPVAEITNGVCSKNNFSLTQISAYLAFGGICIHFQLMPIMKNIGIKLWDFMLFRIISALLSAVICKIILLAFPVEQSVFLNTASPIEFASVNPTLSALMIIGCFVGVSDVASHLRRTKSIKG